MWAATTRANQQLAAGIAVLRAQASLFAGPPGVSDYTALLEADPHHDSRISIGRCCDQMKSSHAAHAAHDAAEGQS